MSEMKVNKEQKTVQSIKKEDAISILDRTIGFINNCDNKSSIVLGIFGALLTIMFSGGVITDIKNIVKVAIKDNASGGILYCFLFISSSAVFCYGIYRIFLVLFPRTDCKELKQEGLELKSLIYFGNIYSSNFTYKQYKEKIKDCGEEKYFNDILSQIYINSYICKNKFRNYKKGVIVAIIGFIVFVILWGIGILIY